MEFTKMHGLGNDYIYIDCIKTTVSRPDELSRKLSDRHFGIGSDGLVLILPSKKADFYMDIYNADGSRAEMCGNALRCVGKYVYEMGLTQKTEIYVETLSGIKHLRLKICNGHVGEICADVGTPEFSSGLFPINTGFGEFIDEKVDLEGILYKLTAVIVGNPHAVIFLDDVASLPLEILGPKFESHPLFPNKINTEFIKIIDPHTLEMRVWERGSGETLACGTGACAATVAAIVTGRAGDGEITVRLRGGNLKIFWDRQSGHIFMTGPAEFVFHGKLAEQN